MRIFAHPLVVLASLVASAAAEYSCIGPDARTRPPAGAIVVDPTGAYSGSFRNVSEAVGNVPNTTDEHTIFLFPGIYREQVLISKLNGPLVLQGYTCNTTSYAANTVYNNLNVANTAGKFTKNGQAVATIVEGNNSGFYACN
ncbi:hypothetical protein PF005_g26710 [Phytophthora fragariae]|uniref:Pectinesterase n=1 Tax=Phytophthora fragariae TaxID=53985 RepID=A0A6A3GSF0_9STRA|nr:hypothetical protein PF011_g30279 [Phytophthora fragariae]KAE9068201.1 hypothetical protein PF006_g29842 [Phytophthora fragariae]KAE9172446.1 hypothetical protein PF005_g26710 [Phytophthora fragariae]KAE9176275.1 hypothetical protein PF002_g28574 [Phytophthora fragariae]